MEQDNKELPLVIDCGAATCRFGYAGDEAPRSFPCVVGRVKQQPPPQSQTQQPASANKDAYVGLDAMSQRTALQLSLQFPVEHGTISHWEDLEKIWRHVFDVELHTPPEDHPVLLTDVSLNPKSNRERMTQIMFESMAVPALYISTQAILALYASGRTTGLVVDSGEKMTYVIPVVEGYAIPHTIMRCDVAGAGITEYLGTLLSHRGLGSFDSETLRDIKEKVAFSSEDFVSDLAKAEQSTELERNYALPDGKTISLNAERFKCTEVLFNPSLMGVEQFGVAYTTFQSILKCDADNRKDLYAGIVLAGGSTLFPGFDVRFRKEVTALVPPTMFVKVVAPPERRNSAWMGGSILASLSTFETMWISKKEYDDSGPSIVHRKCY